MKIAPQPRVSIHGTNPWLWLYLIWMSPESGPGLVRRQCSGRLEWKHSLGKPKDQCNSNQGYRQNERTPQRCLDRSLSEKSRDGSRQSAANDEQQHSRLRGLKITVATKGRRQHPEPILPKEPQNRDQGSSMKHNIKRQALIRPTHKPWDQDQMGRAADWQELRHSLYCTKDDGLNEAHIEVRSGKYEVADQPNFDTRASPRSPGSPAAPAVVSRFV